MESTLIVVESMLFYSRSSGSMMLCMDSNQDPARNHSQGVIFSSGSSKTAALVFSREEQARLHGLCFHLYLGQPCYNSADEGLGMLLYFHGLRPQVINF